MAPKRTLIVCRKPPYGNALAREALDVALTAAVFEQPLAMLFIGDGVWQLLDQQDSAGIKQKNHSKVISAFPLYELTELYIDADAMQQRQLSHDHFVVAVKPLAADELGDFIARFDTVLSF